MLMNYVEIKPGETKTLHFTDHYWVDRMIWDKDLNKEKPVRTLVFQVDEVDGEMDLKTFSVLSTKLSSMLAPYLPDSAHRDYNFRITRTGAGFLTDWQVEAIPRPAP